MRVTRTHIDPHPTDVAELRAMLAEYRRYAGTSSEKAEALEPGLLCLAQDIFPEHEDNLLSARDVAALLDAHA